MLCAKTILFDSTPNSTRISQKNTTGFCEANVLNPTPILCDNICNDFAESMISIVSSNKCNFTQTFIAGFSTSWTQTCRRFLSSEFTKTTPCTRASSWDANSCGFGLDQMDKAREFCKNSSAECCSRLAIATASPTPAASSQSNGSALTPAVIGTISAVILIAIVVAIVVIMNYYRKKQRTEHVMVATHAKARLDRMEETIQTIAHTNTTSSYTRRNTPSAAAPPSITAPSPAGGTSSSHLAAAVASSSSTVAPSTALAPDSTFSALWKVITPYEPQMGDEVLLQPGEFIVLETIYNDGWARGTNQNTRMFGYLPMACLEPIDSAPVSVHDREADVPTAAASAANTAFAPEARNSINSATLQNLTMTNISRYDAGATLSTYNNEQGLMYPTMPNSSGAPGSHMTYAGYGSMGSGVGTFSHTASGTGSQGVGQSYAQAMPHQGFSPSHGGGFGGSGGLGWSPAPESIQTPSVGGSRESTSTNQQQQYGYQAPGSGYSRQNPFSMLDGSQGAPASSSADTGVDTDGRSARGSDRSSRPVMSALGSLARSNGDSTMERL
ncbi:hypothetical protein BC829DRAFT_267928 [Chytridium lagenaria]|nr:hypothetical protein BC829DRAFT_267928 [Chytridium lagenaria]